MSSLTTMTSPDGLTWTIQNNAAFDPYGVNGLTIGEYDGLLIAGSGLAYGTAPHRFASSTDGINWSPVSSPIDVPVTWESGDEPDQYVISSCIRYVPQIGLWLAAVNQITVNSGMDPETCQDLQSNDGSTWTQSDGTVLSDPRSSQCVGGVATQGVILGPTDNSVSFYPYPKYGVDATPISWSIIDESAITFAVSACDQTCVTSDDGSLMSILYLSKASNQQILSTWDGTTFAIVDGFGPTTFINSNVVSGKDGAGLYIAVVPTGMTDEVGGGTVWGTSSLSVPWNYSYGSLSNPTDGNNLNPTDLAFGNELFVLPHTNYLPNVGEGPGQYFDIPIDGPWGAGTSGQACVFTSGDLGITWSQITTPFDGYQINGVVWSETLGLFVAVGYVPVTRGGWTVGDVNWSGAGSWAVGTTP